MIQAFKFLSYFETSINYLLEYTSSCLCERDEWTYHKNYHAFKYAKYQQFYKKNRNFQEHFLSTQSSVDYCFHFRINICGGQQRQRTCARS